MKHEDFIKEYIITNDRRGCYCKCDLCGKGMHYSIPAAMAAVERNTPLQCSNCQSYEVMPIRREDHEDS